MRITLFLIATLLSASACIDPECPDDMRKIGITCFPIIKRAPDGGAAADAETDGGRSASASAEEHVSLDGSAPALGTPDGDVQPAPTSRGSSSDATVAAVRNGQDTPGNSTITDAATVTNAATTPAATPCPDGALNACGYCGAVPKEVCDQKDNNCDGAADEGLACKFWYRDCDADGFAASNDGRAFSDAKPAELLDCDGWSALKPATFSDTDCDDKNASRHPGAAPGLPISVGNPTLPPQDDPAYDLNCDGRLEAMGGLTKGIFVDGKLVMIPSCPDPNHVTCLGGPGDNCILQLSFVGGAIHCGEKLAVSFMCSTGVVYSLCQ